MLHRKRLAAAALSLSLAFSALGPAIPALAAAWEKNASGSYVDANGSVLTGIVARGIDVSHWKQSINWNAVAADDIQFVMLGTRYDNAVDPYFHIHAQAAFDAGLKVGAYIYSYASTTAMAEQEADFVLNLIKNYPISYPVVMDVESPEMSNLTPAQLSDVINAFCKKVENAGYYPMIYTNDYWLSNKIDMSKMHYDVWAARYDVKPAYSGAAIWQATNKGIVNGISGDVDINFAFKNFSEKLPPNRWRFIGDNWYYYKNYVMQTGWINDGQSWYYLNQDGTQYKGWLLYNNDYYYLLPKTGQMQTGWLQADNKWYYLKEDGRMAKEWVLVNGKYYYLLDGVMVTGWLRIGDNYYYLKSDGSMVTGWRNMDNAWYYFNSDGTLVRGWADIDGKRYFMKSDGKMVTGWQTIDNSLYYFDPSGALGTKWQKIDNYWYYFDNDGKMMTGWIQLDGDYYYLHTDGRMVTGWQSDGTNKYYMDPSSGKMSVSWKKIDNAWYYFNASGHMITGWLKLDGKYYYLNPSNGQMISNGSIVINNINYTFDKDGVCQNETSAIDGGSAGSVYSNPTGGASAPGNVTMGNTTPGGTAPNSTPPGGSSNTPGTSNTPGGPFPGTSNSPGGMSAGNNNTTGGNQNTPGGSGITSPGTSSTPGGSYIPGTSNTSGSSIPGTANPGTSSPGASNPGTANSQGGSGSNSAPNPGGGSSTVNSSDGLKEYQTSGPK